MRITRRAVSRLIGQRPFQLFVGAQHTAAFLANPNMLEKDSSFTSSRGAEQVSPVRKGWVAVQPFSIAESATHPQDSRHFRTNIAISFSLANNPGNSASGKAFAPSDNAFAGSSCVSKKIPSTP